MNDPRYEALLPFLSAERVRKFEEVLAFRTRKLCLVLENIYQSRNASAVMRTCDGLGIQDVHLVESVNPWVFNRAVSKGTPAWLSLHRYKHPERGAQNCIQALKSKGYRLAVTSPHLDGKQPHELPVDEPLALIMGTESSGVSEHMLDAADYHVYIPMHGFAESLNISVAAGIVMSRILENLRRRPRAAWQLTEEEAHALKTEWAIKSVRKADQLLKHLGVTPTSGSLLRK